MRKYDRTSSILWFLVGLFIIREGNTIYVGTLKEPGPGFLFFWSGIILCGLSVLTFVKAQLSKEKKPEKIWEGLNWYKPVFVLMITFVYTFFFLQLGFLVCTFLLMLLLLKMHGSLKWPKVLFISFLSTFSSWLIFDIWLKCQFPKGVLEKFLISVVRMLY